MKMRLERLGQCYRLVLGLGLSIVSVLCSGVALPSLAQAGTPESAQLPYLPPAEAATEDVPEGVPISSPSNLGSNNYLLGPGDQVTIAVIGYPEFDGTQLILPDGTLSLPLIGAVQADNQTLATLSQRLSQRLQTYLVNPAVSLSLESLRPVWITVGGEVTRPGPIQLGTLMDDEVNPTLTNALTAAGGVTRQADIRQVQVQRQRADGSPELLMLNLWDGLGTPTATTELLLRDGDVVWVPELDPLDIGVDRTLIARSTIAPETVSVRVVGEVVRPGEVEVPPSASLSSAVAIAGGPTDDARLSQVGFVRMDETGQIMTETVDLRNLTDSYQVQDGDVLIVPKTGLATGLDYFARFLTPFNFLFNLFD